MDSAYSTFKPRTTAAICKRTAVADGNTINDQQAGQWYWIISESELNEYSTLIWRVKLS